MKRVILLFLLLNCCFLMGFDDLFEYKLDLIKKYKPGASWDFLEVAPDFALKFEEPDSFIKMGTCLVKAGGKIFIVDNIQHKIVVFSEKGRFLRKLGRVKKPVFLVSCPISNPRETCNVSGKLTASRRFGVVFR